MPVRTLTICFLLFANLTLAVDVRADTASVLTIWRLLDYMAIDYRGAVRDGGEQLWKADAEIRRRTTLASLIGERPATLAASLGEDQADRITAYLRRNPRAVVQPTRALLALARTQLDEAILAYEKGDHRAATDLALSAYFDRFEPVEPLLSIHDNALMRQIESAMGELRAAIKRGAAVEDLRAQAKVLARLFGDAEAALDPLRLRPHPASSAHSRSCCARHLKRC